MLILHGSTENARVRYCYRRPLNLLISPAFLLFSSTPLYAKKNNLTRILTSYSSLVFSRWPSLLRSGSIRIILNPLFYPYPMLLIHLSDLFFISCPISTITHYFQYILTHPCWQKFLFDISLSFRFSLFTSSNGFLTLFDDIFLFHAYIHDFPPGTYSKILLRSYPPRLRAFSIWI